MALTSDLAGLSEGLDDSAEGGIRGGQTVGRTDGSAGEVIDRPISAADYVATICRILGIDGRK